MSTSHIHKDTKNTISVLAAVTVGYMTGILFPLKDIRATLIEIRDSIIRQSYETLQEQLELNRYGEAAFVSIITTYYNSVISLLGEMFLDKLYVSVTNANSIFFRFSRHNSPYEFKLEVFYDYNPDDEDDIEAILHVYKNNIDMGSYYGSLEYLIEIIKEKVFLNSTSAVSYNKRSHAISTTLATQEECALSYSYQ